MVEGLREERIRVAVIERDVRRRWQDDEDAVGVDPPAVQQPRVWLEVGKVVLLLQAGIPQQLRGSDSKALEPIWWDRVGHDHLRRRTHAELVLELRELVVVGRRARDAQAPGAEGELVRSVRQREVEAARSRPAVQRAQAGSE